MINIFAMFILWLIGLFIFFILYLEYDSKESLYKVVDESCYYCIYSTKPYSIRDKNKNTCKIIDNTDWTSEQVRHCKHRLKNE